MKAYINTWKYGNQQVTMVYHGEDIVYDADNAVLLVRKPVIDNSLGLLTVVHIINTDEITIERCVSYDGKHNVKECSLHGGKEENVVAEDLVI